MSDSVFLRDETKTIADVVASYTGQNQQVYMNVLQPTIVIAENTARLILLNHLNRVEARKAWIAPAGILVSVGATLATATFQDMWGLKASDLRALFLWGGVFDFCWLLYTLYLAVTAPNIEDVLREMKSEAARQRPNDTKETLKGPHVLTGHEPQ